MPVRATKRGAARVPFPTGADADVLICGASFAGLTVARELRATGARVLILDRYEIGERQTSACAAPTEWLRNLGLEASIRQTFDSLLVHTPRVGKARWPLPFTFSTFDYPQLCDLLFEQTGEAEFDTAKVISRTGQTVSTDRGDVTAPLIVDALGWRRVLGVGDNFQPPDAPLSRGLEVHPKGTGDDLELWIDPRYVDAGYGWAFPADDEVRIGVGSFDPHDPVKQPTLRLVEDVNQSPDGYQGNWIPHRIRPATEDGIFFAGDSAGHCIPLTAEGIRTAFYFGIALGRELRAVLEGRQDKWEALSRYHEFSASHKWKFESMYLAQQSIRHLHGRPLDNVTRAFTRGRISRWAFQNYLEIAPPSYAVPAPPAAAVPAAEEQAA
ncbi:flavin-dependent dehydrogenase [Solirubrobacter pauli]|uniref:Flavin-dependent dehydrogenase n=1 Tax=Solirubrobacter pauli TaxID=166793 RepID=A0A660KZQ3_9ACTN|nr:NAD(P)/FAD-dependent oxidoreductase [Solirubrobacter pauli]RKQ86555.1 flavin-dependent dehydrogenase [Solirubrobacter pauli]